jgi:hypothetical protein
MQVSEAGFSALDRGDCKSFLPKTGFHYAQVPFKTDFTVLRTGQTCSFSQLVTYTTL